ncbi:hypothetical protein FOCC_FOCC011004 [Frankliniella occidentalis]|uniref:Uncharacterized protein LOC127750110 n=1 Tax=Frankliniella occidentalis TaxID=133901 RepID=A0A9C6X0C3_FRAOC|nr:uncharacterized protein LOC127750110 [Frankliniella occidentalis]XP_052126636.1 uncharacterized protein LOC127750110 [Frankliniella occidentalis]KAE8743399.1 hypothetical protein FOCC_FOCC011004 [Frankliniella occidentalis]
MSGLNNHILAHDWKDLATKKPSSSAIEEYCHEAHVSILEAMKSLPKGGKIGIDFNEYVSKLIEKKSSPEWKKLVDAVSSLLSKILSFNNNRRSATFGSALRNHLYSSIRKELSNTEKRDELMDLLLGVEVVIVQVANLFLFDFVQQMGNAALVFVFRSITGRTGKEKEGRQSMEKDCFPSAKEQNRTKCEQMRPFKNLRIILDGVEIKIETPSNFHMQGNTYSQYKGCNTVRFIVGIDSSGATAFISPACEGALSEKEAVLRSGLLQRLEKGDLVMTDRGFEITAELQAIGVHHVKPPSLGQRDSLTAEEETLTKAIACVRIYSEHAIADIKDNKLLRNVLPLSMYPEISDLVYVAGYLRNFSPKRIISKSFSRRNPDEENGNNPDDL